MKRLSILQALALAVFALLMAGQAGAADIKRHGDAYVIYLPEDLDYHDVVDRLQTEILAQNWDIVKVQDIDIGLRQLDVDVENKVIMACQSQYLKQAIEEDPFISLIIPCRFVVFREVAEPSQSGEGRIVVGFVDPVAEAESINVTRAVAAAKASEELQGVLQTMADFYKE